MGKVSPSPIRKGERFSEDKDANGLRRSQQLRVWISILGVVEMAASNGNEWFLRAEQSSGAELLLFCFPYAGGTASMYRKWASLIPPTVEIIPVEPPGRGRRLAEPSFRRLPALIEALTPKISSLLDRKFALFGHSMGAVIAFELARELRRRSGLLPEHIFISGSRAPQVRDETPITYDLPENEFRAELQKLNGTPAEVLENAELMNLMLPLLRADFELVQTYQYCDEPPLDCPLTIYGGLHDPDISREMLLPWEQQTKAQFSLHMLPGDHFFLRSASHQLLDLLRQELFGLTARFMRPWISGAGQA